MAPHLRELQLGGKKGFKDVSQTGQPAVPDKAVTERLGPRRLTHRSG
jgi:hypothetical protein